jgi:hypothetical protein
MLTADIAPPSSLLLIMDRSAGRLPESMAGRLVAFTRTCVAVGTRSADDGTTCVTLDNISGPLPHHELVFDGALDTPSRKLAVCSVLDEVVLEIEVATERVRVMVWANDRTEPTEVHVRASMDGA